MRVKTGRDSDGLGVRGQDEQQDEQGADADHLGLQLLPLLLPASTSLGHALQDVEHEAAGDEICLREPHFDLLRQAKRQAGPTTYQGLLPFIVLPIIVRQRAHRHETARAAFGDCDEKSETRHTGNSRSEIRTNFIRHVGSEVTVDGVAFGELGTAFGRGDVRRGLREARGFVGGKGTVAQSQTADQRTMHQQIGVAPDRTGEMRIARQGQAEMPDIVGAVFRLRLTAQHDLVDQERLGRADEAAQHAVEIARMHLVASRQRDAEPVQEVAQRRELVVGRRGVHAIHHRLMQALQFLGGGDIGEHHELLDQPMAVETRPWRDAAHDAVAVDHHTALREVEIERAARGAGGEQGAERRIRCACRDRPRRAPAARRRRSGAPRCASGRGRNGERSCGHRRRYAVRRTGSRGPRQAAGCTSRWTMPRAASARRGRGNRRCCRACAPPGRAPSPGARSAPRRRSPR